MLPRELSCCTTAVFMVVLSHYEEYRMNSPVSPGSQEPNPQGWLQPDAEMPKFDSARAVTEFVVSSCGIEFEDVCFEDVIDPQNPLDRASAYFPGMPHTPVCSTQTGRQVRISPLRGLEGSCAK